MPAAQLPLVLLEQDGAELHEFLWAVDQNAEQSLAVVCLQRDLLVLLAPGALELLGCIGELGVAQSSGQLEHHAVSDLDSGEEHPPTVDNRVAIRSVAPFEARQRGRGRAFTWWRRGPGGYGRIRIVTRRGWMALFFALGSTCFLVGPFPGFVQLVGVPTDAITFFVGSILFTAGGALQTWLAWEGWRSAEVGARAVWWSAIVQSAGTLFFNVTTYQAMHVALTSSDYDRLVWRPDWRGSICFLVSGAIAYRASPRGGLHGWLPARGGAGWWQPAVNLLGCIFFGISAVAGYVVPSTGSMIDLAAANWNTSLGAACFLACALDTLRTGRARRCRCAEPDLPPSLDAGQRTIPL